jgi:hypothetical protein
VTASCSAVSTSWWRPATSSGWSARTAPAGRHQPLDLPAIEQLEALDAFPGTLLLVTHDRRMLERVRLTRRWHVEAGRVVEIDASDL